jgi:hypothetical protein
MILNVVMAKDGLQIGADRSGKSIEGGGIGLQEIRSGTGKGIGKAWQVSFTGDLLLLIGLPLREEGSNKEGKGDREQQIIS